MPQLHNVKENGFEYIVWDAQEPIDFFMKSLDLNTYEKERLENIKHPTRELQFICARFLLRQLLPEAPQSCFSAEEDIPVVNDRHEYVSISHSETLVAVMIHDDTPCGIDIQCFDSRILRIKDKFSTKEERFLINGNYSETQLCTLLWTAKEAVYKCLHTKGLDFKVDMVLNKVFDNHVIILFTRKSILINVRYIKTHGYFLCCCTTLNEYE